MSEKTIMLVGATGSGKSTLVDGLANYLLGVKWDDPYRLSIVDLEEEEQTTLQNQVPTIFQIPSFCFRRFKILLLKESSKRCCLRNLLFNTSF